MKEQTETTRNWLQIYLNGDSIERVSTKNTIASLLASKNGTEVIHHSLAEGGSWGLFPQEGWDELESVFVISGCLTTKLSDGKVQSLSAGDFFSASPVISNVILTAVKDSQFLYICSNSVFQHYSEVSRKFSQMAIEIEEKDGYTAEHCERIRRHSILIGEEMGLRPSELLALSCGGFFHDIGKIRIPDEILNKPGRLSPEEFDIIKQHTIVGRDILLQSESHYLVAGCKIAEQHHERYDGSGYPYGLSGDQIDLGAAIVAVVDSFDAMTSNRPYQPAKSREQAVEEIRSLSGRLYHPDVVDAFLSTVNHFLKMLGDDKT